MELIKAISIFLDEKACYEEAHKTYQLNWCACTGFGYTTFEDWIEDSPYVEDWITHKLSKAERKVIGKDTIRDTACELMKKVKKLHTQEMRRTGQKWED